MLLTTDFMDFYGFYRFYPTLSHDGKTENNGRKTKKRRLPSFVFRLIDTQKQREAVVAV